MQTMTASNLAERLADDVDSAFPEFVIAHQDGIYGGALRMLRDPHDAEEVAQEAFLRAYRALLGYPAEKIRTLRLDAWLWTIAANLCRNRHRSRSRKPSVPRDDLEQVEAGAGPEDRAVNAAIGAHLEALLADLPWTMRSAVVLRYVADLDYAAISDALGRPVGTVKSDVHRGLERLRSALEEKGAA